MAIVLPKLRKRTEHRGPAVRSEDGLLFIDCRECTGPSSLGDAVCVKCVSKEMVNSGPPARLMIRKELDVEHSENVVSVLTEISKISSLAHTASLERPPGKCGGCPVSIPKNAKDIWDAFPEPRFDIMRLEAERSKPDKEGCEECLWKTIGFIDQLETMFSENRKNAAKRAFRLAEV
ncbi:MAG: hypothetical protein LBE47_00525 [Methanomassiliicoccaceae archaeon]|jgi:hypothetical protein|nr:hypothetical protein [Methanomassiliicoccaceae archaeon]